MSRKPARVNNQACIRSDNSVIISSDESESDRGDDETIAVIEAETSRTATKRKAPYVALPLPLPKRIQISPSTQDIPRKAASQKPPHNPRFWYPDGNIVIKVEGTYFKLFRSRLAQQCRYFQERFSPPKESQPQPSSSTDAAQVVAPAKKVDGCAVYEVPGINVSDFTTFLTFLEYPLEHTVSTAPSDKLYALLRASDTLGCDLVHGLAKQVVANQWPSLYPPEKNAHSHWDKDSRKSAKDAIQAIVHARKYRIPRVLKGAFHELLRNPVFWDAVRHNYTTSNSTSSSERGSPADRAMLAPLPHGDIVRLQEARWELRDAWDQLVRAPLGTCGRCPPSRNGHRQDSTAAWAVELAHAGVAIAFGDPIVGTYHMEDWLDSLKGGHSQGKWCDGCLKERMHRWGRARETWWQELDGWLQIVQSVEDVGLVRVRSGASSKLYS